MINCIAKISYNKPYGKNVFKMVLNIDNMPEVFAGQFVMISCGSSGGMVLKRPLSIHSFDDKSITLIYETLGKGTEALSKIEEGNNIDIIFPLGKGFVNKEDYKKIVLIGGGLGVIPLYSVIAQNPKKEYYSYFGFRDISRIICEDVFRAASKDFVLATDDGSVGQKGFITEILKGDLANNNFDVIFACGPKPMLRALKNALKDIQIPIYVSMEERMGCGFGACLTCTCKTVNGNVRVCADGPVFDINEVEL